MASFKSEIIQLPFPFLRKAFSFSAIDILALDVDIKKG